MMLGKRWAMVMVVQVAWIEVAAYVAAEQNWIWSTSHQYAPQLALCFAHLGGTMTTFSRNSRSGIAHTSSPSSRIQPLAASSACVHPARACPAHDEGAAGEGHSRTEHVYPYAQPSIDGPKVKERRILHVHQALACVQEARLGAICPDRADPG